MYEDVLRYMGFRSAAPSPEQKRAIVAVMEEMERAADKKSVYALFPLKLEKDRVLLGPLEIESQGLRRHLSGCSRAVVLAATLGASADGLIRRYTVKGMSYASCAQAAAAALLEDYLDDLCRSVGERYGSFLKPRFSPGYGDFPLSFQKPLLELVDAPKRIGVTLTDGSMMTPTKSVTAVVGLTEEEGCREEKCAGCGKKDCPFREEGEKNKEDGE